MNSPVEIVLKGGRANVGQVVRVGNEVARPTYPQTPAVEDFLRHLVDRGLSFIPEPIGTDEQGRHRLRFIPGIAPTPPYPAWAFDEDLLIAVAQHQRRIHDAARSYVAPRDALWAQSAGDYFPTLADHGTELLVCHNDLGMTNTIVDSETKRFAGFIDFDYCRPVDPLFDIAVAARHWVPFGDLDLATDVDLATGPQLDRIRRFGIFADTHELGAAQRSRVVQLSIAFLDKARQNIANLAAAGQVGFQRLLADGYEETNLATVAWLHTNAETLAVPS